MSCDRAAATAGGTLVVVGHFIRKATGQPEDPTAPITFTVVEPDETSTVYTSGTDAEVTNPRVGSYELAVLTAVGEHGVWVVTLDGGGPSGGSYTEPFLVVAA
jgi:hypothetical protein